MLNWWMPAGTGLGFCCGACAVCSRGCWVCTNLGSALQMLCNPVIDDAPSPSCDAPIADGNPAESVEEDFEADSRSKISLGKRKRDDHDAEASVAKAAVGSWAESKAGVMAAEVTQECMEVAAAAEREREAVAHAAVQEAAALAAEKASAVISGLASRWNLS
jgi:hypothetical protein